MCISTGFRPSDEMRRYAPYARAGGGGRGGVRPFACQGPGSATVLPGACSASELMVYVLCRWRPLTECDPAMQVCDNCFQPGHVAARLCGSVLRPPLRHSLCIPLPKPPLVIASSAPDPFPGGCEGARWIPRATRAGRRTTPSATAPTPARCVISAERSFLLPFRLWTGVLKKLRSGQPAEM
jgi:hypothetical protein